MFDLWLSWFGVGMLQFFPPTILPLISVFVYVQNVKQSDFNLPTLGPKLVGFRDEAVNGRGFVLLRGLPVEQWPVEGVAIAYWGLGSYWGKAQPQNRLHHLLGHVKVCLNNQ